MFKWLKRIFYVIVGLLIFAGFAYFDGIQYVLTRITFSTGNPYFNAELAAKPNCEGITPCSTGPIKVLTFNVLCRHCNPPDAEPWELRLPHTQQLLQRYDADLLGLQELMDGQDIQTILGLVGGEETYGYVSYTLAGLLEYPDCALLYRKARFELLDSGQMWLSPKPTVPLAKGWKKLSVPRYVNWAYLRQKDNGFRFLYVNTHFDNNGPNKEPSAVFFNKVYGSFAKDVPMIFTGDFNTPRDTDRFKNLIGISAGSTAQFTPTEDIATVKEVVSGNVEEMPNIRPATITDFDPLIDHILVGGAAKPEVKRWALDLSTYGTEAKPISDHPLVYAEVELKLE